MYYRIPELNAKLKMVYNNFLLSTVQRFLNPDTSFTALNWGFKIKLKQNMSERENTVVTKFNSDFHSNNLPANTKYILHSNTYII